MDPAFALCFRGRLGEELEASGADLYWLGGVRVSRPLSVWRARQRLATLLLAERIDVVVCHADWSQAIFGPTIRAARRPLVAWLHNAADGHWLGRWTRRITPDLLICNSKFTATQHRRRYPDIPAEVIYCPIEALDVVFTENERRALRAEFDTPLHATVIVQVGRLEELKGHLLHMEALGMLRDVEGWVCWQVGAPQRPSEAAC